MEGETQREGGRGRGSKRERKRETEREREVGAYCELLSLQEISQVHRKILTIAGYVLVPISLVFLLATILAYVMLR